MKNKEIRIGTRVIGDGQPCFVIAEMSANHQQNYDTALAIVHAAARAGADAIKVQTYMPDLLTITSDREWFRVDGKDTPDGWKGKTLHELYEKAYMPWEWHAPLKKEAEANGLLFFSAPVEASGVEYLEKLDMPCYKIASYEATDHEFLTRVAQTGKPILISAGFMTAEELEESLTVLRDANAQDIIVFFCLTSYQEGEHASETNLRTMLDIRDQYGVVVGFSDNMGGIRTPILAAAMGASAIEKHLVPKHGEGALDDRFSLDEQEFARMVKEIRTNEILAGIVHYGPQTEVEKQNVRFRRSLFVVRDVAAGEVVTRENVRSIRPGDGLPPGKLPDILGKKFLKTVERGTPLTSDLLETP